MKNFTTIFLFLILTIMLSCNTSKQFTKARYNINNGSKKVNVINKRKAEWETQYLKTDSLYNSTKVLLAQQKLALSSIESAHKSSGLEKARDVSEEQINLLYEQLKQVNPYSQDGHKKSLEILTQINDLIYNRIIPIGTLIVKNKQIKELQGDFSFKTGSSKLSESGINEIKKQLDQLENDIYEWKGYLNNHNERIFEKDRFKLTVIIEGYADKQGSDKQNLKLSSERAESVRNEFVKQINLLATKHKLLFDVNFEGKGELLPPGVIDNGKEVDSNRRICRIISVVGPSRFVDSETK